MQGVVKAYDPATREGLIVRDTDRAEVVMSPAALAQSIFRVLRQGQRVVFELDDREQAINVRSGAEVDMGLPTAQL